MKEMTAFLQPSFMNRTPLENSSLVEPGCANSAGFDLTFRKGIV